MKIGRILNEVVGGAVALAAVGGIIYSGIAVSTIQIENTFFHSREATVQEGDKKIYYRLVEPYDSWIFWGLQDKDGYAKVWLDKDGGVSFEYDDLTQVPLQGKVMVDSKGQKANLNDKAKYNSQTRKSTEELKEALETVVGGRSLRQIVEQEMQNAIAGK